MAVLSTQLAAPNIELESRICDAPTVEQPVQPHMFTTARNNLEDMGAIEQTTTTTRGGSAVGIWRPVPTPVGKKRLTEDAAARKRLLVARWHSWSRASRADNMPNLIGIGGEAVVHQSLRQAAPFGYRLVQPTKGEVTTLFGEKVPGGSLDNAAWLTPMNTFTQTPTGRTYLIPIEVKNLRGWLYPKHWEVHQLLHKAALLSAAQPDHPMLPILICRRVHPRLRWMASDLGFMIFETYDQYVYPNERVSEEHFHEVRDELGLHLRRTADAHPALVEWLSGAPISNIENYSDTWSAVGSQFSKEYSVLRKQATREHDRIVLLEQVHSEVVRLTGDARNWATSPDGVPDDSW